MKLKPYPKYKESGIDWIGEIPEGWGARKFSSFGFFSSSGINKKTEPNEPLVKMVNYTDIYGNDSLVIDSKRELMTVSCPKGKIIFCDLKKGDIVFTPSSETEVDIGLSAVILENLKSTVFSYHVIRFRTNIKMNLHYKKYIGNNHFVLSQFSSICKGTTRQILIHNDFKSILTMLPPFQEQITIAKFLDKKTAEISKLIEKDKKLIELLKEKRTALINLTVTKGLDPNVKLKDSGIEWIGKIPEGWEVKRLKLLTSKINSGVTPKGGAEVYTEKGIPLLRSQNIHFEGLKLENVAYIPKNIYKTMLNSVVKNQDVLINITGASIGRCTYVDGEFEKANVNQHVCIIRPNKIDCKYFTYFLRSKHGQDQVFSIQMGSSREGLNFEQLGNFAVPFTSISVQIAIVSYLDKETLKIGKTIQKIEEKIKLLEEYKKSLINHTVTGKMDVRGPGI